MKPSWEKNTHHIGLDNFYSMTGCDKAQIVHFLLMRFLQDFFEDHSTRPYWFTFARLSSGYHYVEAVFEGSIIDIEFFLYNNHGDADFKASIKWSLSMSSLDELAVQHALDRLLEYINKGIGPYSEIEDASSVEFAKKLHENMERLLNLHRYKGFATMQEYSDASAASRN